MNAEDKGTVVRDVTRRARVVLVAAAFAMLFEAVFVYVRWFVTGDYVISLSQCAVRAAILVVLVLVLYGFRPAGRLFSSAVAENGMLLGRCLAGVAVVSVALAVGVALVHRTYFSAASVTMEQGMTDEEVSSAMLAKPQQEYDQLAVAILSGHTWIDDVPPQWLQEMEDPYDPVARAELASETGEAYDWDTAYYGGRYYVYFGVVPCLAFFLPFRVVTGTALAPGYAVVACEALFVVGAAMLVWHVSRRRFPRASVAAATLALMGILATSGLVFVSSEPGLYELPGMMGLALAVWGLYFWARARDDGRCRDLLAGSVLVALVAGCRPQLLVIAPLVVPLLVGCLREVRGRRRALSLVSACAPFALVAAALMWYNAMRFGSPLDFGASYNLTTNDMTAREAGVGVLLAGAYAFLVQPASVSPSFPFVTAATAGNSLLGTALVEPLTGGVLVTFPFYWSAPLAWLARRRRRALVLVPFLLVAGVVVALFDAAAGGLLARYQLDFCWLFALAAALAFLAVSDGRAPVGEAVDPRTRALRIALVASVVLAVAFAAAVTLFLMTEESVPTGSAVLARHASLASWLGGLLQPWL